MRELAWLGRAVVEMPHGEQIREHGGRPGLRDGGMLESALARPQHLWTYGSDVELAALAAEYGYGLAQNHPFLDGNKRIAFVATNVFLLLNGFEVEAPEPEVVETMLRVADGRMSREEFAAWVRRHVVPYAGESS